MQFELSGPSSGNGNESIPPEARSFLTKAKAAAAVITAITALIAAVTALVKTMDTSLQKASYEELAESIKKLSEDTRKQYDDLKAIHEYLDKDRELRRAVASASPSGETSAGLVSPPTVVKAPTSTRQKVDKPKVTNVAPPVPPPPPTLSPKPVAVVPPDFKAVENKAQAEKAPATM